MHNLSTNIQLRIHKNENSPNGGGPIGPDTSLLGSTGARSWNALHGDDHKHDEGFCLFDSKRTDYCAPKQGPGRDVVREYIEAARFENLSVGLYYSLMDLHHPDWRQAKSDGDLLPVDFVQNAASLGAWAKRASTRNELAAALREAVNQPQMTVIVVETSYDNRLPGYESWWDVAIAEVSERESVRAARREYQEACKKERLFSECLVLEHT